MRRSRLLDTEQWTVNHEAVVGLVSLVFLGILSTVGLKAAFGYYDPGYELTASFEGAGQNLDDESVIKLRGVDVGRVESIDLGDDHRAVVRMHIDPDVEVPETTVAVIRPISIFGPKFIDLVPGRGEGEGPFLADGDEIERTRSSLELGDILGEELGVGQTQPARLGPADGETFVGEIDAGETGRRKGPSHHVDGMPTTATDVGNICAGAEPFR